MTRTYAGEFGVQILKVAKELALFQNIQTSSTAHRASNSMKTTAFSMAVKWPRWKERPLTYI
jgi:hypothetical protein